MPLEDDILAWVPPDATLLHVDLTAAKPDEAVCLTLDRVTGAECSRPLHQDRRHCDSTDDQCQFLWNDEPPALIV